MNDAFELKVITEDSEYLDETMRLYRDAFPENERRSLKPLIADARKEGVLFAVLNDGEYVGFIALLSHERITHILYFATEEEYRDRGFGRHVLQLVKEAFPDHKIIADIEEPDENSFNSEQREKRLNFYVHNGYRKTDIEYEWEKERYVIMANGDYISREEFDEFWDYFDRERTDLQY